MNQTLPSQPSSIDDIRKQFPALARVHAGRPVAYFDGPGGTQVPRVVVEAMTDYLYHHNANTHWAYPTSNETDALIASARQTLAEFLNASPDEIAFGQNMTSLTFHLARALGRGFRCGDEIVVTELDHHGNVDTWRSLEVDRGVKIRVLPMNSKTGQLKLDQLPDLLSSKTKLIAIGAASNALGTINDIHRAVNMAREAGVLSFVDAVHYAPHHLIDVKQLGCDFLVCSAYKFYGPHIGILFGRKELLEQADFPKLKPAPDDAPERVETGTQSHEAIVGAAAAVEFIASLSRGESRRERLASAFAEMQRREAALVNALWEGLSGIKGVRVYGPALEAKRTALVAFSVKDYPAVSVSEALTEKGIFASSGDFYAATVVERLGLGKQGLVRAACACYTTSEEVQRVVAGVESIAAGRLKAA
jgi:cysteine desulfurase family protein (TIGR01976 family)